MQVFVLNRKHLAIGLGIAIICLGIALYTTMNQIVATVTNLNRTVVIDAGHGSVDPGAHYEGLEEKDINLKVAFILKELLEEANIKVIMTRTDDSLYNKSRNDDILYRVRLTNEVKPDAFISIHVNKFPTSEPFGGQAYYYSSEQSKALAEEIQAELKRIQPDSYRKVSKGNYFVLKRSNCPAVLVEIGFISNPVDRKRMTDPSTQREIAGAIRAGLLDYFNANMTSSSRRKELVQPQNPANYKINDISEGYDVYFAQSKPEGATLIPVHAQLAAENVIAVHNDPNVTFLEKVAAEAIKSLISGPDDGNLSPVLPKDTRLLSLNIEDGMAIVNFSKELITEHWGGAEAERITLEAIVKTLTSFHGIDEVQILIEGEVNQTIGGHIVFDEPYSLNMFQ